MTTRTKTATRPTGKKTGKASTERKKDRKVGWAARIAPGTGVLRIWEEGTGTDHYFVAPMPSDFGSAFLVEKIHRETMKVEKTYHVCIDPAEGHRCDCLGHESHGHCRHVESLSALASAGRM